MRWRRELGHGGHAQAGGVKHQVKLLCQRSGGVGQGCIRCPVRIFFTVFKGAPAARQPSGPLGRSDAVSA